MTKNTPSPTPESTMTGAMKFIALVLVVLTPLGFTLKILEPMREHLQQIHITPSQEERIEELLDNIRIQDARLHEQVRQHTNDLRAVQVKLDRLENLLLQHDDRQGTN